MNTNWTPERIETAAAAVQAALTEAQGHDAAMTAGRGMPLGAVAGTFQHGLDMEYAPKASNEAWFETRADRDGFAYMRNTLPQYIARLQQDLDTLHALAEAEGAYRAAGFKYWPVEKEPAMDRLDETFEYIAALAVVEPLRARCQQIADALGVG